MTLLLFGLGYLALPLVVGLIYWRGARRREAVLWTLAVLAAPIITFVGCWR